MGFYFRKSKSFGPFRINLSKSGIGLSTGVKGARLSIGPKGTYVNMGRNGLYYRKKIGSKNKRTTARTTYSANYNTDNRIHTNVNPTPPINIGDTSYAKNSYERAVIRKIKSSKMLNNLWNVFFWGSLFLGIGNPCIWIVSVITGIIRCVFKGAFVTEINCDLEEDDKEAWEKFISSLNLIKTSNRFWMINSIEKIYGKSDFGSTNDIDRKIITNFSELKVGKVNKMRIKSNCQMFQICDKDLKILFLPELLIIFSKKEISLHTYNQFNISHSERRFIENPTTLPNDAEILEWKYQHTTKDGTMDLRYKNNPRYPICKYGMLSLSSSSGLLIQFELSNVVVSEIISKAFDKYVLALNTPINTLEENGYKEAEKVDDIIETVTHYEENSKNLSENDLVNSIKKYVKFEEN